ncbi:MAG TPA: response regulator transcription factor [Cyclobacteriaceae bacterium]|jgi:DNA-binding NarL/FixJ family response regulator|nr:response regulator transcription factor [Cytophagales bacterium]HRE67215.1 response regulator transcription factor [Cyclobacteriaceae bacterium]HRF35431.1 response regulator transcription factor [Cyclobacteriaceae bacterium]
MTNILIADDHQMFVDGLKSLLEDEKEICVVGEAKNGKEVLDYCEEKLVDLVIMDINMPVMDGIQTSRELSKRHPLIKILGLSMYNDQDYIADMLQAGALGYILKNTGKENLIEAIKTIQSGENYLGKEVSETLLNGFMKNNALAKQLPEKLSDRELEVLESIASGLTTQEIGEKLFISKNTVETHRKNLLYKLKARNTAELINNAYKQRLIR